MFFLSDANFARGRDKKKRKPRLGTLSLLTTPWGATLGAGLGMASGAALGMKSKSFPKYFTGGTILGTAIGGTGGYIAGQKMDKKMKFGKYQVR